MELLHFPYALEMIECWNELVISSVDSSLWTVNSALIDTSRLFRKHPSKDSMSPANCCHPPPVVALQNQNSFQCLYIVSLLLYKDNCLQQKHILPPKPQITRLCTHNSKCYWSPPLTHTHAHNQLMALLSSGSRYRTLKRRRRAWFSSFVPSAIEIETSVF